MGACPAHGLRWVSPEKNQSNAGHRTSASAARKIPSEPAGLQVGFPKAVEVAELENGDRLLTAERDFSMRGLAWFQATREHAFLGHDVNPLVFLT